MKSRKKHIKKKQCPDCGRKLISTMNLDTESHGVIRFYSCENCPTDYVQRNGNLEIAANSR